MDKKIQARRAFDFSPPNAAAEIVQNVAMIIATQKGSVPYDRAFGIDYTLLDAPQGVGRARLAADTARAIAQYEPRAVVRSITWGDASPAGIVSPVVSIEIIGGDEL